MEITANRSTAPPDFTACMVALFTISEKRLDEFPLHSTSTFLTYSNHRVSHGKDLPGIFPAGRSQRKHPLLVPGAKFPADRQGIIHRTAQAVQLLQGCHRTCKEGESAPKDSPGFQGPSSMWRAAKAEQSCALCHLTLLGSKG